MLVVADSSPVNVLIRIGHVGVLPHLFQRVLIPTIVAHELSQPRTPQQVKDFVASPPSWFVVREPSHVEPIAKLGPGEQAAISLAAELGADLLLIDERAGRRAALERKLSIVGTVGILERAAEQRLLALEDAFASLRQTDFRVSDELIEEAMARYRKRVQD